jgi:hypothetical protein
MLIINPLYDAGFKYLLEDLDIAKAFLSLLLGKEVVSLVVSPQEMAVETDDGKSIKLFRLDFRAIVKLPNGEFEKILIEIQKSKRNKDLLRFRRYLGMNYRTTDELVADDGTKKEEVLPITAIYFLGFRLPEIPYLALQVRPEYINLASQKQITPKKRCLFIESLTHTSIYIQVPRLKDKQKMKTQTKARKVDPLEKALEIFDQRYLSGTNRYYLDYQGDESDPLVSKMLSRLKVAALNPAVIRQLEAEEELEQELSDYRNMSTELQEKKAELQEKKAELQEKKALVQALTQEKVVLVQEKKALVQALAQEKAVLVQEKKALVQALTQEKAVLVQEKKALAEEKALREAREKERLALLEAEKKHQLEREARLEAEKAKVEALVLAEKAKAEAEKAKAEAEKAKAEALVLAEKQTKEALQQKIEMLEQLLKNKS